MMGVWPKSRECKVACSTLATLASCMCDMCVSALDGARLSPITEPTAHYGFGFDDSHIHLCRVSFSSDSVGRARVYSNYHTNTDPLKPESRRRREEREKARVKRKVG